MEQDQTVVFIHGLGETPAVWHKVAGALPPGFHPLALPVPGLSGPQDNTPGFSLAGAGGSLLEELDRRGISSAHLCGLSLGAMLALQIATTAPSYVRTLTLAAGQAKPPRRLLAAQSAFIRRLPDTLVAPEGASKKQMLAVLDAVATVDFTPLLPGVTAPTLVLCGSKDRPNLPAARQIASAIPDARLRIIPGAGHQSQRQAPAQFAVFLGAFLVENTQSRA